MILFKLIRVKSWVKNGFLILPLIFSLNLFKEGVLITEIIGFFSFSFCCSFIYILNDIIDINADQLHPRKKLRPLPAGKISKTNAQIIGLVLLSTGLVSSFYLSQDFFIVVSAYVLLNICYSVILKEINILEFLVVAINFVLRVLAGCFLIKVEPSGWILVVTFFLALFLIITKRKSEIIQLGDQAANHRKVLKHYTADFLDKLILISGTITLCAYLLYSIDPEVIKAIESKNLIFTSVFVVIGLFRYIQLNSSSLYEGEGDPTTLLFKDPFTQLNILLWMGSIIAIIYG